MHFLFVLLLRRLKQHGKSIGEEFALECRSRSFDFFYVGGVAILVRAQAAFSP